MNTWQAITFCGCAGGAPVTPRERYENLIEQAVELERMAGTGNFGGPTYWDDRRESTLLSLAHAGWRRKADDRFTWALPPESCDAIHAAFDNEHYDMIWKAAAAVLRKRAAGLREELQGQADQIAKLLAEIPK